MRSTLGPVAGVCRPGGPGGSPPRSAVVLTGGDAVDPGLARLLPPGADVIAADAGLAQAGPLRLAVDLAVGDFDSVPPPLLEAARAAGCHIERHPAAKDHSDLELALLAARARGAGHVVVVGGHGGRLDHLLANALVLAGACTEGLRVEALVGPAHLAVVRPDTALELVGRAGELVTLLALGGPARRVRTAGLAYPLDGEDLEAGSTRGLSNHLLDRSATVEVGDGTLLVVRPGPATSTEAGSPGGRRRPPGDGLLSGSGAPEPPGAPGR